MDTTRTAISPATLARGALRRLAQSHLEPTPENYARAYAEEVGANLGENYTQSFFGLRPEVALCLFIQR